MTPDHDEEELVLAILEAEDEVFHHREVIAHNSRMGGQTSALRKDLRTKMRQVEELRAKLETSESGR